MVSPLPLSLSILSFFLFFHFLHFISKLGIIRSVIPLFILMIIYYNIKPVFRHIHFHCNMRICASAECLKGRSFGAYRITCEIMVKLRLLQSRSLNIQVWYSNASILFLKPLWILIQLNCWNKSVIKVYSYLHKEHLFWLHFMSA